MGTDDIGVVLEGMVAYLNGLRQMIRSDVYVEEGDSLKTCIAACQTTAEAIISNTTEQDAIVTALGALTTTVAAIVADPTIKSDITDAIADYLTALALL